MFFTVMYSLEIFAKLMPRHLYFYARSGFPNQMSVVHCGDVYTCVTHGKQMWQMWSARKEKLEV